MIRVALEEAKPKRHRAVKGQSGLLRGKEVGSCHRPPETLESFEMKSSERVKATIFPLLTSYSPGAPVLLVTDAAILTFLFSSVVNSNSPATDGVGPSKGLRPKVAARIKLAKTQPCHSEYNLSS